MSSRGETGGEAGGEVSQGEGRLPFWAAAAGALAALPDPHPPPHHPNTSHRIAHTHTRTETGNLERGLVSCTGAEFCGFALIETKARAMAAVARLEAALDLPRPVRVHCASGFRSYLAHRVLTAHGLDSASLDGGLQTLLAARPGLPLVIGPDRSPVMAS